MSTGNIDQMLRTALGYHKAGHRTRAKALYLEILAQSPKHDVVLQLLGAASIQDNNPDLAIDYLRRANAINPSMPACHSNLGNALMARGEVEEAIECYRRALSLNPQFADAYNNLGIALTKKGNAEQALDYFDRALRLNPAFAEAHFNLGTVFECQGKLDAALASYRRALELKPTYAEAHFHMGTTLKAQGKLNEAIACCRRAVELKPDYWAALNQLGLLASEQGKYDEATSFHCRAIALKPDCADAHNNLGVAMCGQGKVDEAIALYRQALGLRPEDPDAHNNLGTALTGLGRYDEAMIHFNEAIRLEPHFSEAYLNRALLLLLRGDFDRGWSEYEWRWKTKTFSAVRDSFKKPQWEGGPLNGLTILLHAEQGFGDTLQFVRYAALLVQTDVTVIVNCQPPLKRLLQFSFEQIRFVDKNDVLSPFDVHCPLLSLPRVFRTTLLSIPQQSPYVRAEKELVDRWQKKIADYANCRLRVGLVWAGSKDNKNDRNRSLTLLVLARIGQVPGVQFFSLQKGEQSREATNPPSGMHLVDWSSELNDFADTAGLISNLDLIISVDTAVAHLAGALGKPTWTLLPFSPDWRWLLGREDTPWYPTMRLFRQTAPGDWETVANRVLDALRSLVANESPQGQVNELAAAQNNNPLIEGADAIPIYNLGLALHRKGAIADAADCFRRAIALRPDFAESHNNLGNTLTQLGHFDEAARFILRALELKPDYALAHNNLGVTFYSQAKLAEATACFRRAVDHKPDYADAHNNLGAALRSQGKVDEAVVSIMRALELRPGFAEAQKNLGVAYYDQGRLNEAVACYRHSLNLKPDSAETHRNLAKALKDQGELDQAERHLNEALRLSPGDSDTRWYRSLLFLLRGDFGRGWSDFESRWMAKTFPSLRRSMRQPQWNGQSLVGRTILLHAEQGLGDTIQFIRYAQLVVLSGANIIVECQAPLCRLLQHSFRQVEIVQPRQPPRTFDVHCPLLSLPWVYRTTIDTIPRNVPYLSADAETVSRWRHRIGHQNQLLKIGLVWAGNKDHTNDRNRSLPLPALSPLAAVDGIRLFSLQKEQPASRALQCSSELRFIDWTDELHDFSDTAGLIANMDLIISADTAVAHLAGAMGKPVWTLLPFAPDWRWLLQREDSPWYPTMQLFRQPSTRDWTSVIIRVTEALRRLEFTRK